ncbi:hypothetical protein SEA_KEELAN_10 [Gordonia phage Keelan]|nr:hypothetical protein SEA_KEELAN_10 [Gordonia phage Keelan]
MLADTLEDVDLESLLEQDVPCVFYETKDETCGKPAIWSLSAQCGHNVQWCQEHMDFSLKFEKEYQKDNPLYKCMVCNNIQPLFELNKTRRLL